MKELEEDVGIIAEMLWSSCKGILIFFYGAVDYIFESFLCFVRNAIKDLRLKLFLVAELCFFG